MLPPNYDAITDSELRAGEKLCLCGEIIPATSIALMCSWCEQLAHDNSEVDQPDDSLEYWAAMLASLIDNHTVTVRHTREIHIPADIAVKVREAVQNIVDKLPAGYEPEFPDGIFWELRD